MRMEDRRWRMVLRRAAVHPAIACVFLAAATLVAFWPVVHCDFINYDDADYVTANPHVQAGLTWGSAGWSFRLDQGDYWHPLSWLSHMLDCELFGLWAGGHHLTSLLLHAANTVLLFVVLRRLTGAHWRSALVAALFALHPLHVESVAWVTERKDLLSTLFWMLTLLFYARYVQGRSQVEARGTRDEGPESRGIAGGPALDSRLLSGAKSRFIGRRSTLDYVLALFFFACGLMSKAMVVTLPFVLLLLDWWPLGRVTGLKSQVSTLAAPGQQPSTLDCTRETFRARLSTVLGLIWEKVPFFVLAAISSVLTVWGQQRIAAVVSLSDLPISNRIGHAFGAYTTYLGKTFWPVRLALPYPAGPAQLPLGQVMLAGALVAGLCVAALWLARRRPYVFAGWYWFWGTLVPVIGLVRVGSQSIADRFTYVPLIGVFIIVAWGAGEATMRWRRSRAVVGLAAALALVCCGLLTHRQVGYWQGSERLFRHTLAVTDGNAMGLFNLGAFLTGQGRTDEAIQYFRSALQISPSNTAVLYNLGNILAGRDQYAEAVGCFETAWRIKPDRYEVANNLANALVKLGKLDDAVTYYRLALQLEPWAARIHSNLAGALSAQGKLAEATLHYRGSLRLEPDDAGTHYALGLALALQGEWDEAILHYQETLRLAPTNAEAWYNLGYAFRVQGRFDEAVTHLREALRLKPEFPVAHYNLGCVLADKGQHDEAMARLKEALRLQPDYEEARQKLQAMVSKPKDGDER